jgi:hypothetical protein
MFSTVTSSWAKIEYPVENADMERRKSMAVEGSVVVVCVCVGGYYWNQVLNIIIGCECITVN